MRADGVTDWKLFVLLGKHFDGISCNGVYTDEKPDGMKITCACGKYVDIAGASVGPVLEHAIAVLAEMHGVHNEA